MWRSPPSPRSRARCWSARSWPTCRMPGWRATAFTGQTPPCRRAIEAAGKGYVLTVTSAQHLGLRPVGDWAKEVPKGGWTRLSAGDGAKGPRLYDWACVPFRGAREGWQKALLIRRSLEKPDELTFYPTLAP